ncbi:MAG: hypothetical protein K0S15_1403 [Solirubrobacterales bacterium]|jgi:hypothetical protein|nr:hypothetical protein [Solirubrobacterales bacterium]
MVPGYVHHTGHHCGSTALRNLLAFHGCEISEEMAFGLGAGAAFFYVPLDGQSPSRFTNGRTARLEENFLELTGAPLRLRTDPDPDRCWQLARADVNDGRPVLLLTDLYYLDHYGTSAHFPGHAVVLAGYDSQNAWLSDTGFEELQSTRLEHLAQARHSKHPAFPLDGQMIDLAPSSGGGGPGTRAALDAGRLRSAAPAAIARAAQGMLEPEMGDYQGLPALERLAAEIGSWPETVADPEWCARFLFQVIERRGTGGGNFRSMYSRFLKEAGYGQGSELASDAARRWTSLAGAARTVSEDGEAEHARWAALSAETRAVLEAERRLWESLARAQTNSGKSRRRA